MSADIRLPNVPWTIPGKVAVIVVTFNSSAYIRDCLESLNRQSYKDIEIIVVDNCSLDTTRDIVHPFNIHLIANAGNKGFAAANNQGSAYALDTLKAEYILLLNPDTVAHEGLIERLVESLESDEKAAIAQGRVFLMRAKDLLNADGILNHFLYFGYCSGYGLPAGAVEEDKEITVASGSCLMLKGNLLERLGNLFTEEFFIYHEDTDLCLRARLIGQRCILSGKAVVWHDYRFSSSKGKFFHMEKNRLFLLLQNYRATTLLLLLPAIIFTEAQVSLYSLLGGWFGYKLKSYLWLVLNIGLILKKRRSVQATRTVGDLAMLRLFVPDINFEDVQNVGLRYVTNPVLRVYYRVLLRLLGRFGLT
ncbi:MAG: glycosyltransferase family 2 protein [Nitrospirota bacterium]